MTAVIDVVQAWEALDSRGRPTTACRIVLRDGSEGVAVVPAGASTGSHEAVELRDGGERYDGRGTRRAVANVRTLLAPRITGLPPGEVDGSLANIDPADRYASVGANAVLAVSVASARAAAASAGLSLARYLTGEHDKPLLLPMPMINIISGGAHAGAVIDVQDFLVVPVGAASFGEAIEWAAAVRESAAKLALARGHQQAVLDADEGGLGLPLASNRAALDLLVDAIDAAGLTIASQVGIAIDVAATQFHHGDHYRFAREGRQFSAAQLVAEIADWCASYPIVSVEDPLAEDDWAGWKDATSRLGSRIEVVGDDVFVTNPRRLAYGIENCVANSVLVKVNQNGLVAGARDVVAQARSAGYRTIVSARSGDTEDAWLADLAVGWRAGQIKVGSTHRAERTGKWNRLLQFEATENTTFAGPWRDGRPGEDTQ